jgi:DNA mismatch endonuclease (patch repair protein)
MEQPRLREIPQMVDVLTAEQRSRNMRSIRASDTLPEMRVRRVLHRVGFRYRLHGRNLPGRPDLVFPKLQKVVFIHGCFWHMHTCRFGTVTPKTNADFWKKKRQANVMRDQVVIDRLKASGWQALIIWECETRTPEDILKRALPFLATDG